jgi:pseudouridine synthase
VQGVQAVGRLDQDTTGLLLLTDDGKFIHRMSSPRHHVPKVYEVTVKHPLDDRQVQRLLQGVVLDDDPKPVAAAACEAVAEHHLRLTLTEGKYHQVKRMVAAVGNRVEGLHRSRIGGLALPADWRPVSGAGCPPLILRPSRADLPQKAAIRSVTCAGWSRCGEWPHAAMACNCKSPCVGAISSIWRIVP